MFELPPTPQFDEIENVSGYEPIEKSEYVRLVNCVMEKHRYNTGAKRFFLGYPYGHWGGAVILADMLLDASVNEQEAAIKILRTIVAAEVSSEEFESMVKALSMLGKAIWEQEGKADEALLYLQKASEYIEQVSMFELLTLQKGQVWARRLYVLTEAGRLEQAMQEIELKFAQYVGVKARGNSYLYYACLFKAWLADQEGCKDKAKQCLREAFPYGAMSSEERKEVRKYWHMYPEYEDQCAILFEKGIMFNSWEI